jgi:hypothetical protein
MSGDPFRLLRKWDLAGIRREPNKESNVKNGKYLGLLDVLAALKGKRAPDAPESANGEPRATGQGNGDDARSAQLGKQAPQRFEGERARKAEGKGGASCCGCCP